MMKAIIFVNLQMKKVLKPIKQKMVNITSCGTMMNILL